MRTVFAYLLAALVEVLLQLTGVPLVLLVVVVTPNQRPRHLFLFFLSARAPGQNFIWAHVAQNLVREKMILAEYICCLRIASSQMILKSGPPGKTTTLKNALLNKAAKSQYISNQTSCVRVGRDIAEALLYSRNEARNYNHRVSSAIF